MSSQRKILFGIVALILAAGIFVLVGSSTLFGGKLTFFHSAPTVSQVMDASYISYRDAVSLLVTSAQKKGRIVFESDKQLSDYLDAIPQQRKITRGEFAALAVDILALPPSTGSAQAVATFIAHGGAGNSFKAENFATDEFARNAVANLEAGF